MLFPFRTLSCSFPRIAVRRTACFRTPMRESSTTSFRSFPAETQNNNHLAHDFCAGSPLARGRADGNVPAVTTFTNTRRVRIEWGDCDPAGIIFYPRYFEIFDASTAMLFERALGMTKLQMFKNLEFSGFPLVRPRARFLKPTRFGDDVTIDSTITFGRSSF